MYAFIGPTYHSAPNLDWSWPGCRSRDIEEGYVVIRNVGCNVPVRRGGSYPTVNHIIILHRVTVPGPCLEIKRVKYVEVMENRRYGP